MYIYIYTFYVSIRNTIYFYLINQTRNWIDVSKDM